MKLIYGPGIDEPITMIDVDDNRLLNIDESFSVLS
jgi:hypothetical protein